MAHAKESHKSHQRLVERSKNILDALKDRMGTADRKLEIVLKCDSIGSVEAVESILGKLTVPNVAIQIIHSGVGAVSKSDLVMALTGGHLVLGFNVGVMPKLDQWVKDHGVEVRLYDVIYRLVDDIKRMAESFAPSAPEEKISGKGKVIALFKSSHKGSILGCQVTDGVISLGCNFRVISAMGPIYSGKIASMHIEKDEVKEARPGQQVGVKLDDFNQAQIGDLVECYETSGGRKTQPWGPAGEIIHIGSS